MTDGSEFTSIPIKLIRVTGIKSGEKIVNGARLNHFILISDCSDCAIVIQTNQKIHKLVVENCKNCYIQVRDSVVINSRTIEVLNCSDCNFLIDEVDVRTLNCFNVKNTQFEFTNEPTLLENLTARFDSRCSSNEMRTASIKPGSNPNVSHKMISVVHDSFSVPSTGDRARECNFPDGLTLVCKSVDWSRSEQDFRNDVNAAEESGKLWDTIPSARLGELYDEDLREFEDSKEELKQKAKRVAKEILEAKHVVVYTGAGISTSAKIPDYRGPQGVWTMLKKGSTPASMSLSQAYPTYAHYALTLLVKKGFVKYIVSTNLDGLHRRSGTGADEMSELHGNCYKEVCAVCSKEYLRGFDTLTSREDRWSHLTGRKCNFPCRGPLKDTIVHFTENMPKNQMDPAMEHARKSDFALVIGTSMNVQPAASLPEKSLKNPNGKLVIVNLQKTPFDDVATLNVFGRSDEFMMELMKELGLPEVDQTYDHTLVLQQKEEAEEFRQNLLTALIPISVVAASIATYFWVRKLHAQ